MALHPPAVFLCVCFSVHFLDKAHLHMIRISPLFKFHLTSHNTLSKYESNLGPTGKGIELVNVMILIDYLGIIITAYRNMS